MAKISPEYRQLKIFDNNMVLKQQLAQKDRQIASLKNQLYILSSKFRQCAKHDEYPEHTRLYLEVKCVDCVGDKL